MAQKHQAFSFAAQEAGIVLLGPPYPPPYVHFDHHPSAHLEDTALSQVRRLSEVRNA